MKINHERKTTYPAIKGPITGPMNGELAAVNTFDGDRLASRLTWCTPPWDLFLGKIIDHRIRPVACALCHLRISKHICHAPSRDAQKS